MKRTIWLVTLIVGLASSTAAIAQTNDAPPEEAEADAIEKVVPTSDTTEGSDEGARPPTEPQETGTNGSGPPEDPVEDTMLFTSCSQVSTAGPPWWLAFVGVFFVFRRRGGR